MKFFLKINREMIIFFRKQRLLKANLMKNRCLYNNNNYYHSNHNSIAKLMLIFHKLMRNWIESYNI